jgi:hypothetical protein
MRAHGCEQLVLMYRDRPAYVTGRERWAAYQRDRLQARLERGTGRRIVRSVGARSRLEKAVDVLERLHPDSWFDGFVEEPNPYRYCGAPDDR